MGFDISPVRVAHLLMPHTERVLEWLKGDIGTDPEIITSAEAIRDLVYMISTLDDREVVAKLQGPPGPQGPMGPQGFGGRDAVIDPELLETIRLLANRYGLLYDRRDAEAVLNPPGR